MSMQLRRVVDTEEEAETNTMKNNQDEENKLARTNFFKELWIEEGQRERWRIGCRVRYMREHTTARQNTQLLFYFSEKNYRIKSASLQKIFLIYCLLEIYILTVSASLYLIQKKEFKVFPYFSHDRNINTIIIIRVITAITIVTVVLYILNRLFN